CSTPSATSANWTIPRSSPCARNWPERVPRSDVPVTSGRPSHRPARVPTMTFSSRSESPRPVHAGASERHPKPPAPGDLYRFHLDTGSEPEWLVVRAHPDDLQLLLTVPVDPFPLAGP